MRIALGYWWSVVWRIWRCRLNPFGCDWQDRGVGVKPWCPRCHDVA